MASVNRMIVLGHVGRDPEVRYTTDGAAIANVSIATTRTWKDKQGEKQEETEWHRISFFGRLAEIVGEYVKKGSQIYVEGRLRTRKWQDKEGTDRYTTEIVAESIQLLGGRGERAEDGPKQSKPTEQPRDKAAGPVANMEDDIPF